MIRAILNYRPRFLANVSFSISFYFIFVMAALADRYPEFTTYSILISAFVIVAQMGCLYIIGLRNGNGVVHENEYSPADANSRVVRIISQKENHFYSVHSSLARTQTLNRYLLVANYEQLIRARREFYERLAKVDALEAAAWNISAQGKDAFTVTAGAFEIEHFHGKTNIRVLDTSQVTVEGPTRGSRLNIETDQVKPPSWN